MSGVEAVERRRFKARSQMFNYNDEYFDYISDNSERSAEKIISVIQRHANIRSVLDVGCGRGAWLKRWHAAGISDVIGVDGPYVQTSKLPFAVERFHAVDLTEPLFLKRRFDLVQCLEVAEHLPLEAADTLVDSLARHSDVILFSAAVPGQGGLHHINEQPIGFWHEKFSRLGFNAWDVVRPAIRNLPTVEPWYRFNTVLYSRVPLNSVQETDRFPAQGYAVPFYWRCRNLMLWTLPRPAIDALARFKHTVSRSANRPRAG